MNARTKAALIFACTFVLYFLTRSLWLDEWDSVQFALGLDTFDLWKNQPHPPGYPVYILAGKFFALFGLSPVTALVVVSCLGGAAFVAIWFLIAEREYGESFAWVAAAVTAFTPVVWMTATKVLTDIPAAAALSAQVLFALSFRRERRSRDLGLCALLAALATGIRPQLFGVTTVLLVTALVSARAPARTWGAALAALLVGNVLWLAPTCALQARTDPDRGGAFAYPQQLLKQWRWRLDKPTVYVGAPGMDARQLADRARTHAMGWMKRGLGLSSADKRRGVGLLLVVGLALTLARARHGSFWAMQAPWAVLLVATVFCCLPEDRRYYVGLTPLLWIAALSGSWTLLRPWRFLALTAPALMLGFSVPLAIAGHTEPPPPVQMLRYLQDIHPPAERGRIWLMLGDSRRHGNWYAKDFRVSLARDYAIDGRSFRRALVLYTDSPKFPASGRFEGCVLEPVAEFSRNPAVYPKHSRVQLFRIRRPGE